LIIVEPSTTLWYGSFTVADPNLNHIQEVPKVKYKMDSKEFLKARKKLKKTQKLLAELLGVSIKAVHSYEQGWRSVPAHVERQIFFLLSRLRDSGNPNPKPCWVIKKCPTNRKKNCPAWEFQAGKLCWFINGTVCECQAQKNWKDKMAICRQCEVLSSLLDDD